jgi:hypothetical protein
MFAHQCSMIIVLPTADCVSTSLHFVPLSDPNGADAPTLSPLEPTKEGALWRHSLLEAILASKGLHTLLPATIDAVRAVAAGRIEAGPRVVESSSG